MRERVIAIIAEALGIVPEKVTEELAVYDIPEWGSIAQMQIITQLEDQLRIKFPVEELYRQTNVRTIVGTVCALTGKD